MASRGREFDFEDLGFQLEPKPEELALLNKVQESGIIGSALEKLWVIREGLKEIDILFDLGEFDSSLTSLDQVSHRLVAFEQTWEDLPTKPKVIVALHKHLEDERNQIITTIINTWKNAINFQSSETLVSLHINSNVSVGENPIDFNSLLEAVFRLEKDLLKLSPQKRVLAPPAQIESLLVFIDEKIIAPILDTKVGTISVTANEASVLTLEDINSQSAIPPGPAGLDQLIDQVSVVINYLSSNLRKFPLLYDLIIKRSSTSLVNTLCNKTLRNLMPISINDKKEFEVHLVGLEVLETTLGDAGWPRAGDLQNWIQNFPVEWIAHRKVLCLDEIRSYLLSNCEDIKLSRVPDSQFAGGNNETAALQPPPVLTPKKESGHTRTASGWDNEWNEDFDDDDQDIKLSEETLSPTTAEIGDDDGWGLDSDDINISDNEGGGEDDWGWGDEEDSSSKANKRKSIVGKSSKGVVPTSKVLSSEVSTTVEAERKNALLCSISEYPSFIGSTIQRFITESKGQYQDSGRGSTTSSVSHHVSDMLALYRALSPIAYKNAPSRLILHNDLTFLVNNLDTNVEFNGQVNEKDRMRLVQLSHQYASQELMAQQEQLDAVLKQANGFENCNQEQNLFSCQATIERTINLFYEFSEEWGKYASFPQRVKALGTLLEYLCSTFIHDIEHQDSISEEESMELTKLIGVVQQLEELFIDPTTASSLTAGTGNIEGSSSSLTLYYTPSWIKFQYLAEILQSKLADILYLYQHNSLVDFSEQELVTLIRALFAPSDHRRKAIEEIWTSS